MKTRLSALFVLVSQALLLLLVYDTSGTTAIAFSFVGHPAMALGVALGIWALIAHRAARRPDDTPLEPQNDNTRLTP